MPNIDIFEGEKWIIKGKHKKGPSKGKTIKLSIKKVAANGTETEVHTKTDITLDAKKTFTYEYVTTAVADNEAHYKLVADTEYAKFIGKHRKRLPDTCTVWPKQVAVTAKDAADALCPGFEFTAKQGSDALSNPAPTDKDGKSTVSLKKNDGTVKFTGAAPYEIVGSTPTPNKLREFTLKVKRNFEVEFIKPKPTDDGKPVEQFINLASASDGQDGKGHEVVIEVGEKADKAGKKGKKGDIIYIQVKFGRESARDNPKPKIAAMTDVTDIVEADAGKTYTAKVALKADDGTAKFKVDLGLAGCDTCEVRVSSTKDSFTGKPLKFVNWRRIFYQLSLPKGAAAPNLTRITDALKEVNVVYEKYKDVEFAVDSGPAGSSSISWFPGDWLDSGEAGKKFLNLGDYNKDFFHGKFVDDKNPVGVHVACCHTQYDANDPSCLRNFLNLEVDSTSKVTWSDGKEVIGKDIWVGGGFFPKFLKDGSAGFVSGTWTEVGGGQSGNLKDVDVWISTGANLGWLTIKLPLAAKTLVTANPGKKVKLTFDVKSAKGPYLGEADGAKKWLQLIVIRESANAVNDVLAHELGHTLKQVTNSVPSGMDATKHGRQYTGNGHQGSHCADGMSAANYHGGAGKAGTTYAGNFAGKPECTCIMYGENGAGSTCAGKFCARCKPFLKAEAVDTLH
jgi:hypothetical protein